MSPLPIIARQRALSQVGEIRCGGEKAERSPGKKLESFRLTSQYREIIETAAGLYGGEPKPWVSPTGDAWQLYTTASSLPCMVIVGYSLTRMYELWEGATKCVRRCDGVDEQFSDGPCLCNQEGVDKCDTVTRLMVMLPETGTSLGWRLRSIGEIAANELDGAMMVAEKLAAGRAFVPATLRLTQRRSVSGGQTKRYVVPVLDFNLLEAGTVPRVFLEELVSQVPDLKMLPPLHTYTPLTEVEQGVTVEQGLASTVAKPRTPNGRSAAPIPVIDDVEFSDTPVPVPNDDGTTTTTVAPKDGKVTAAQKKKLDVLIGKLRDKAGLITTEQLWSAMANQRNIDVETMILELDGRDQDGTLHWHQLRDSLSKAEATSLIDRLDRLEQNAAVA